MLTTNSRYFLDLIEEKESLLFIPENFDIEFNIWMYERIYIWIVELRYFLKKIVNKDELIEDMLTILNSAEGGLTSLEALKLKNNLNIFLKFKDYYYFS